MPAEKAGFRKKMFHVKHYRLRQGCVSNQSVTGAKRAEHNELDGPAAGPGRKYQAAEKLFGPAEGRVKNRFG